MPATTVDLHAIRAAAARLAGRVAPTPVRRSAALDHAHAASVHLKCEHLQHTGSYKARGALNAVLQLPRRQPVLTHSSGNHGVALAWACSTRGLACTVVMSAGASPVKVAAARRHGADVEWCGPGEREEAAAALAARTGASLVHPYEDARVVAGQGTVALELLDQQPGLDLVIAPIGGGGLLAATAVVAASRVAVAGAEPAGADDAYRSLRDGVRHPAVAAPATIADGLLGGIGALPFAVLTAHGTEIVTVTDDETRAAGRLLLDDTGMVVEPSAAVAVAALGRLGVAGRHVGVVLTGGNTDPGWL